MTNDFKPFSLKYNLYNHIDKVFFSFTKLCFAIIFLIISSIHCFSQKRLTDSLSKEKKKLEGLSRAFAEDTNYIKILNELGGSYIYQIPDSTKAISERAIRLSEHINFGKGLAGGKLGLGLYYNINGDFEEAERHLEVAEIQARESNANRLLLKSINAKAMGKFMQGDYPQTYIECKKGLSEAERLNDLEMLVLFNMNLATCFAILKDFTQAEPYYQSALKLTKKTKDGGQIAQIESNLGYLYLHKGDYQTSKTFCQKAIPVLNKEGYQAWEAFAWATLGQVALREKDYDRALECFTKSETLLDPIQDLQRKAETAQGFADTHFLINDFEQSLKYAEYAEKVSKKINYHNGVVKASELLYKLLARKNQHKKALQYLSTSKHLSDSILESENRTKFLLLETQAKFNRDKKLTEFANEKKLAKQKTITYVTSILLLALLIIAILIRKNALNQKKANRSLRELNETKDKLFSIIGHDLKAPIGTLQELLELYTSKEISEEDVAKLAPRLKQNVDHSSFTLNNLLFWAKTQMNGINPDPKEVRIKQKVHAIIDTYRQEIKTKCLDIQCTIPPELTLIIDSTHFEIILRNLISNAVKYSHKRGIIKLSSGKLNEGVTELSICDAGVGMDKSTLKAVTNNQPISSASGTMEEKGTGIGLQIVHDLVKVNNGLFKIRSELGEGTCLSLNFHKG